ncbi:hypothetical protein M885DRAFT_534418 [Pelagophyceae sp. CCMP2097]|nr:hypothetical protein M885DRAFT_534418 [Pelagophyceae sp. CCMP2097]
MFKQPCYPNATAERLLREERTAAHNALAAKKLLSSSLARMRREAALQQLRESKQQSVLDSTLRLLQFATTEKRKLALSSKRTTERNRKLAAKLQTGRGRLLGASGLSAEKRKSSDLRAQCADLKVRVAALEDDVAARKQREQHLERALALAAPGGRSSNDDGAGALERLATARADMRTLALELDGAIEAGAAQRQRASLLEDLLRQANEQLAARASPAARAFHGAGTDGEERRYAPAAHEAIPRRSPRDALPRDAPSSRGAAPRDEWREGVALHAGRQAWSTIPSASPARPGDGLFGGQTFRGDTFGGGNNFDGGLTFRGGDTFDGGQTRRGDTFDGIPESDRLYSASKTYAAAPSQFAQPSLREQSSLREPSRAAPPRALDEDEDNGARHRRDALSSSSAPSPAIEARRRPPRANDLSASKRPPRSPPPTKRPPQPPLASTPTSVGPSDTEYSDTDSDETRSEPRATSARTLTHGLLHPDDLAHADEPRALSLVELANL